MSLNQWIATAVAQKVGAVETAAEFFAERAKGVGRKDLVNWLRRVPSNPAEQGDELPDDLVRRKARRRDEMEAKCLLVSREFVCKTRQHKSIS